MRIELTKLQRIKWFFANYYETGMELEGTIQSLKDKDLDLGIDWIDGKVFPPKYLDEIKTSTIFVIRDKNGSLCYATKNLTESERTDIRSKEMFIDEIKFI